MIEERGEVFLKVSNRKNIILLCVRDMCTNIDHVPCKTSCKRACFTPIPRKGHHSDQLTGSCISDRLFC